MTKSAESARLPQGTGRAHGAFPRRPRVERASRAAHSRPAWCDRPRAGVGLVPTRWCRPPRRAGPEPRHRHGPQSAGIRRNAFGGPDASTGPPGRARRAQTRGKCPTGGGLGPPPPGARRSSRATLLCPACIRARPSFRRENVRFCAASRGEARERPKLVAPAIYRVFPVQGFRGEHPGTSPASRVRGRVPRRAWPGAQPRGLGTLAGADIEPAASVAASEAARAAAAVCVLHTE